MIIDLWHTSEDELEEMLAKYPNAYHGESNELSTPTPCCGVGVVGEIHDGIGSMRCYECGKYLGEY